MSAPRRCRKCGQSIRRRSVGKDHEGKTVRRWCRAEDQGSPSLRVGSRSAPIDCPHGGYHEPLAELVPTAAACDTITKTAQ